MSDIEHLEELVQQQLSQIQYQKREMELFHEIQNKFEDENPLLISPQTLCQEIFNEEIINSFQITNSTIGWTLFFLFIFITLVKEIF
jgi:hypothetical protein